MDCFLKNPKALNAIYSQLVVEIHLFNEKLIIIANFAFILYLDIKVLGVSEDIKIFCSN